MMFVEFDYKEWAERHKIDVINYKCPKCKEVFKTNIPFIDPEAHGLVSPLHDCGPKYRATSYVLRDQELSQWLRDLLDAIKNE